MLRSLIRFFLRNVLFRFVAIFNSISLALSRAAGQDYQLTLPFATYAPWLRDPDFLRVFDQIKKDCLVNIYQCWELWTLGQQTARLGGDFLEVGVWRGGSATVLGRALQEANSDGTLYCCDSFSGLVKSTEDDPHNRDGDLSNASPDDVRRQMQTAQVVNYEVMVGVFPDETGQALEEKRFALCHIDVDTRRSGEEVFHWVWPRMTPGGVVVFQDYGFHRTPGISALVDELRAQESMTVVHNLNGNALIFKASDPCPA